MHEHNYACKAHKRHKKHTQGKTINTNYELKYAKERFPNIIMHVTRTQKHAVSFPGNPITPTTTNHWFVSVPSLKSHYRAAVHLAVLVSLINFQSSARLTVNSRKNHHLDWVAPAIQESFPKFVWKSFLSSSFKKVFTKSGGTVIKTISLKM